MAGSVAATVRNRDVQWNTFGSTNYFRRNYESLHHEDSQILSWASSFLAGHFGSAHLVSDAVDVGAGTNLYPALLMLPWSRTLTLTDYADSNVSWLRQHACDTTSPSWVWQPFWNRISELPGYRDLTDPRQVLASRAKIHRQNIFDLPRSRWNLGSMFFADGITEDMSEFASGVEAFVRALRPGAPFVAAFMADSQGYAVDGQKYPSVSLGKDDLEAIFAGLPTREFEVRKTDPTDDVVRDGYTGMLLVTGRVW